MLAGTAAEENEACAIICDEVAWLLNALSEAAKIDGRKDEMYRLNTAWHNVTHAANLMRKRAQTAEPLIDR